MISVMPIDLFQDDRGDLMVFEKNKNLFFQPKRIYILNNFKKGKIRGNHAHVTLKQAIVCLSGNCDIRFEDKNGVSIAKLSSSTKEAVYIQGVVWREIYNASIDCCLLIIADQEYNEEDYIRDYSEFKRILSES